MRPFLEAVNAAALNPSPPKDGRNLTLETLVFASRTASGYAVDVHRESDLLLSAVAWGTAACASVLAHAVIAGMATPAEVVRNEVRIEVVELTPEMGVRATSVPPKTPDNGPAKKNVGDESVAPRSNAEQKKDVGKGEEPSPADDGVFRKGPKRPNLFERNRAYAKRQAALEPLKEKLREYEEKERRTDADPSKTYACGGGDVERELKTQERDVGHWAPFVPHQLLPEDYAEGLSQVLTRDDERVTTKGYVELALPAESLVMELEEPKGALISVGLRHARCAVGLSHSKRGFPMTWRRIPIRLATSDGIIVDSVVDATLHEDATFLLKSLDGTRLPFRTGRVQHGDQIASRLNALSALARFLD